MTAQTDLRPDTEISRQTGGSRQRRHARKPLRGLWLIVLLFAMAVAAVVGIALAAQVTDMPAPTRVVTQAPSPNDRGGAPATATRPPNANDREGRISPSAIQPPNANEREGRVPATETQAPPNANEREGRLPESHS